MTHDPQYNNARGAAELAGSPPFDFSGTLMGIFPLKANLARLRLFCRESLNLAPEVVQFEPAGPFVLLQIINYGKMSSEVYNAGWVSQHELLFAVPLLRYDVRDGERVFQGPATVCPFIYVDQENSQVTGREVYGWPKVFAQLDPDVSGWESPRALVKDLRMSTQVVTDGGDLDFRPLLEVLYRPLPAILDFPPQPDNPLNPVATAYTAVSGALSLAGSLTDMFLGLPLRGYPPNRDANLLENLASFAGRPDLLGNSVAATINLKQFRDAKSPIRACYQALTTADNTITRLNGSGLLGEPHQLRGDVTGGYEIRICRYASQPILDVLGLEATSTQSANGVDIATLHPLTPYWMDVDFRYGSGKTICWRTYDGRWHPAPQGEAARGARPQAPRYNIAAGGVAQELSGPFVSPDATVRVLPLLADPARLRSFCDRYLNGRRRGAAPGDEGDSYRLPRGTSFEPWGRHVYLVIANYRDLSLGTEVLGLGSQRQASFCVPIKWYRTEGGERRLVSLGLLRAYVYSDSAVTATSGREVRGWPVQLARLDSPPDPWMGHDACESGHRRLLEVRTDVLPALGVGEKIRREVLLEVTTRPILPPDATAEWEAVAATWGEKLYDELRRKQALRARGDGGRDDARFRRGQALALELLALRQPFNDIALRQFRDVSDPLDACYQGIALSSTFCNSLHDLREFDESLHVGIHKYANQPIVDTLGLVVKARTPGKHSLIEWLQPIRPFWTTMDLETAESEDQFWRVHTEEWESAADGHVPFGDERGWSPGVGQDLVDFVSQGEERRKYLKETVAAWRRTGAKKMSLDHAIQALEHLEPQVVLESLLSASWGNQGLPRWWRRSADGDDRSEPDFCIPTDSVGPNPFKDEFRDRYGFEELQDYWYLKAAGGGRAKGKE